MCPWRGNPLKAKGLTVTELLVVLVILAVIFTIAAFNGRRTLLGQEQTAFLRTVQGLFWQGATEAASRGAELSLVRQGNRLELRLGSQTLRTVDIPQGVNLSLPQGTVVRFSPPGKLLDAQGQNLSSPLSFTISIGQRTYAYTVSLIGEVKGAP